MKDIKLISVLMCVYEKDNANYLNFALNSLSIQSKYIYEIILVKDGKLSTQLERVIEKHKKKIKIRNISIKNNVGFPKALNIGLSKVKTKWVARFDSDDICDKNRFKNANQIIKNHGNKIDIFGTYMKEFETHLKDNHKIRFVPLSAKDIKRHLLLSNPMNHISVIFKRELVDKFTEKNRSFYPLINGFEDYALWIKLIKKGVIFQNFPLVSVYARVGDEMLKRRGGIKYIINEIRFRKFIFKYFNIFENFLILIISLLRITIYLLPIKLKSKFYILKRKLY